MALLSSSISVTAANCREYICVQVFGGLGNQMFQLAAGLAQAHRLQVGLLVDPVNSERLAHANFGLDAFRLDVAPWSAAEAQTRRSLFGRFRKSGIKTRFTQWPGSVFRQQGQAYDPSIDAILPGTYIAGYFQSDLFFQSAAGVVRQAFALDHVAANLDHSILTALDETPHVAVHIRRGDYAADPKTAATHGLLGEAYYQQARRFMERLVPNARYIVFSDDLEAAAAMTSGWCGCTVTPGRDRNEDLYLMSRCRHHIIANSTFSWWGAWLAQSENQVVIAPRRWFSRPQMLTTYTDDICPKGWLLL
ncbi:alpha-1,2-fucosyltransferase [Oryzibacter oryziterrae]|uniref:alpha-1,2-fucosyltransferase n=1 Tax=Oryzibacter oryziterrae TaxID=2766474 RepID=UPI0021036ACE|nr:alpha-1,2-fucosyltransferase [Oryzibacter oryziterrae]